MHKVYRGVRTAGVTRVIVESGGQPLYDLPPRFDVRNHSPSGFEWGYGGSGPAQLALAILCDHYGPRRIDVCPGCDHECEGDAQMREDEVCPRCEHRVKAEDLYAGAVVLYQRFKAAWVCHQRDDGWELSTDKIRSIIDAVLTSIGDERKDHMEQMVKGSRESEAALDGAIENMQGDLLA